MQYLVRSVSKAFRPFVGALRSPLEMHLPKVFAPVNLRWMSDTPEIVPDEKSSLEHFSLSESRSKRLRESGITHFFPVQVVPHECDVSMQIECFETVLNGESLLARAPTGSGKTLAYLLPLFERMERNKSTTESDLEGNFPVVAIITPTRELAVQISGQISKFSFTHPHATLVGGMSYVPQIQSLQRGAEIIVGTPGRICDMMEKRNVSLQSIKTLILDEADRMLEMGFEEEIQQIISKCPKEKQVLLFSATIPPWVQRAMRSFMNNPKVVNLVGNEQTAADIKHYYQSEIIPLVSGLMSQPLTSTEESKIKEDGKKGSNSKHESRAILFCETKSLCSELSTTLPDSATIHGDLSQNLRNRSMELFRNGQIRLLIATDVASRGLDIENVNYVINIGLPRNTEDYVHRSGRTARAGKSGTCVTLITAAELPTLNQLSRKLGFILEPLTSKTGGDKQSFLVQSRVQFIKSRLEKMQPLRDSESIIKALQESYSQEELLSRALASLSPRMLDVEVPRHIFRGEGGGGGGGGGDRDRRSGSNGGRYRNDRSRSFGSSNNRDRDSMSNRGSGDFSAHRSNSSDISKSSEFTRDSDTPIRGGHSVRFDRSRGSGFDDKSFRGNGFKSGSYGDKERKFSLD